MQPNDLTILSSFLESGGLMTFIYFLIKGLKAKIGALEQTITLQKQTLAAMEERVNEVKKLSETYANFANELPKYVESYEKLVSVTKDRAIHHLQSEVSIYEKKLQKYESMLLSEQSVR